MKIKKSKFIIHESKEYQTTVNDMKKAQSDLQKVIEELKDKKEEYNLLIDEVKALKQKLLTEYRDAFK